MTKFTEAAKKSNMSVIGKHASESRIKREDNWAVAEIVQKGTYQALSELHIKGVDPTYQEVDLSLVVENPFNAREVYDVDRIEKLAASIKLDGQLVPALGVKQGHQYLLIAGHYRFKALRRGEAKTIKMMVYPEGVISQQKIYEFSFKENEERADQTVLDNALAWHRLIEKQVYPTYSALSEAIGVSQSNVTKTVAILSLSESVLDVVREAPQRFGLSLLYELQLYSQHASENKTIEMANMIKSKKVLRPDIVAAREALSNKPPSRERKNQMSRSYPLSYGKAEGKIKEWDGGKVQVALQFNDDDEKAKFLAYIQQYQPQ